jgi:hypothetical protein
MTIRILVSQSLRLFLDGSDAPLVIDELFWASNLDIYHDSILESRDQLF